jgi:hypothetical protein
MNREIKFRGKDFLKEEWVYGDLVKTKNVVVIKKTNGDYFHPTQVSPSTVGQYTGLKDKNGKEIYEGDIVIIGEKLKTKVVYYDGAFRMQSEFSPTPTDTTDMGYMMREFSVRIIGNIHDNPKLMKQSV